MIGGQVSQRKRWGIGVVEAVPVTGDVRETGVLGEEHGSLNGLLELLIVTVEDQEESA
jgi:hypothetical protein